MLLVCMYVGIYLLCGLRFLDRLFASYVRFNCVIENDRSNATNRRLLVNHLYSLENGNCSRNVIIYSLSYYCRIQSRKFRVRKGIKKKINLRIGDDEISLSNSILYSDLNYYPSAYLNKLSFQLKYLLSSSIPILSSTTIRISFISITHLL